MKTRNVALDLYRILCMFLITTIHMINYAGLVVEVPGGHINYWLLNGIQVLQVFSISGFTMISAYYLVDKPFKINRILKFALSVIFYSIVLYLISMVLVKPGFSKVLTLKSFFPFLTYHYWYPVNYLFLLALAPFLNRLIGALTRKKLLLCIGVLTVICSVYFHVNPFVEAEIFLGHHTHNILWFILLYLIAGYLKHYDRKHPKLVDIGLLCLTGGMLLVLHVLKNNIFGLTSTYPLILKFLDKIDLLSYNSVLSLLFAVSSFALFTQIKITPAKWLSKTMAFTVPAVFVIYLFQEHNGIRDALWSFVNIAQWAGSYWLVPVMIGWFAVLFAVAMVLYLLYWLCDKLFLSKIEGLLAKLLQKVIDCF